MRYVCEAFLHFTFYLSAEERELADILNRDEVEQPPTFVFIGIG